MGAVVVVESVTVDLAAVDAANTALQADAQAAKGTKAYAAAVTKALHAMNPSPPPAAMLWGASNNVGFDAPGIPARLKYLADLGAKVTREDGPRAIGPLADAGIKTVQIIPLGGAGLADARAWCCQLGGNEWWFVNGKAGLDPAAYFRQVLVDAKAIRAKTPGALLSVPLVAYGWPSPLAEGWGACDDHGNYQWQGTLKPATQWLHDAAPELLTLPATTFEVHPYGPRGLANMDAISAQLKGYGVPSPLFLVGEDGWSTYGNSEQAQADYFTARLAAVRARIDVAAWIQYRAQDLVGQSPPSENNYGLSRTNPDWSDGGKKLAWSIVQKALAAS